MNQQKKSHLLFSVIMGLMMISLMTFVVTWANIGFSPNFLSAWGHAFAIAYPVGVPVIYFLAPLARSITAKILGTPS
jgi:Protein of unknown function (DUF2798)